MRAFLLLLLCVFLGWWYFASHYSPATVSPRSQASEEDFPDWRDVARKDDGSGGRTNTAGRGPTSTESPATMQSSNDSLSGWWGLSGGVTGIVGGWLRGIADSIGFFLFGRPGETGRQPDVPADLAKHFAKVEDATVTVEGDDVGATGFVVSYKGKLWIATNIHVLRGVAEREARLTWYEGPTEQQLLDSRILLPKDPNPFGGGRDARYERSRVAFWAFPLPGRNGFQPSYLLFMSVAGLPVFRTIGGLELEIDRERDMLLSRSRDVALIPVKTKLSPLEFSKIPPKKQENIFLVSNPEDRRTVYLVRGSIQGVGPERIEVRLDGKGVGGMSGSPVVSAKEGNVVGIYTYTWTRPEFNPEQVIKERPKGMWGSSSKGGEFAFRLDYLSDDRLADLSPVKWGRFCWEVGVLHALRERTRNVLYATELPLRAANSVEVQPFELKPDFNDYVSTLYNSMVASLRSLSETRDSGAVFGARDSYQRRLEQALESDMRQLDNILNPRPPFTKPPLTVPYLLRAAKEEIDFEQQILANYIRKKAGNLPGRGE
jgi:Trypsin-like peptidase domain